MRQRELFSLFFVSMFAPSERKATAQLILDDRMYVLVDEKDDLPMDRARLRKSFDFDPFALVVHDRTGLGSRDRIGALLSQNFSRLFKRVRFD